MNRNIFAHVFYIVIFFLIQSPQTMGVMLHAQKITCIIHDHNFTDFGDCNIKFNNKKDPILNLYVKLLQIPVRNCLLRIDINSLVQSNNQLRVYQGDWDACAFLKNRQRFKFLETIHETIFAYTNINHTCPYNVLTLRNVLKVLSIVAVVHG
ncbi:uncharacterized protein LOC142239528 [Haematobia irritans]|uniref:uncharacterized protein LOC142239528 n=1 Tax=Haematobia irritans TaxID=7368 RepID=UPI003F4F7569